MRRKLILAIAVGVVVAVSAPASAGGKSGAKCKEAKSKAAAKKASSLLRAYGRNVAKPDPGALAASVSKASSKFTKSFSKAESRGGCQGVGDGGAIEATVDAFVHDVVAAVCPFCGDNIRNQGEQCDGGDDALCPVACQPDCTCASCGDGIVAAGEQCDDGNNVGGDGCSADCAFEEGSCQGFSEVGACLDFGGFQFCDFGQYCELPPGTCGGAGIDGICMRLPDPCVASQVMDLVCGCDGVTYLNDCDRRCAGTSVDHRGGCLCGPAGPLGLFTVCPPGESCCNPLAGSCAPPGFPCTQGLRQ